MLTPRLPKILVTGANGFIGQAVVRHFLSNGYVVRAFVHHQGSYFPFSPQLDIFCGDIGRYEDVSAACKDVDVCIHLAARKSDEADSFQVNVQGTRNLIRAARQKKLKKIIHISTLSTKIAEGGIYAKSKAEADVWWRKSGLPVVILRPSIVYGDPEEGVFSRLVKMSSLPVLLTIGDGSQKVRPIHVEDVAKALELCVTKKIDKVEYDLGGKEEVSLEQFLQKIRVHMHRKKPTAVVHVPLGVGFLLADILKKVSSRPFLTRSNILGSTQEIPMNTALFAKSVGFSALTLQAGLEKTRKEFDDQYVEAKQLLSYVSVGIGSTYRPVAEDIRVLRNAFGLHAQTEKTIHPFLRAFPFSILGVDAASRFLDAHGALQQKILLATTLVECHPASAEKILPQAWSKKDSVVFLMGFGVRAASALIFGIFAFLLFQTLGMYEQDI